MKSKRQSVNAPPNDALWYLPLGGAGEIGMNMNLYGTKGKWLIVDCGVMFGDENTPGIELITPDISFIMERQEDLLGIVATHGHEDHIGGIGYLWQQLRCPIYTTKFTGELIRKKLAQNNCEHEAKVIEIPEGGTFSIGAFDCEYLPVNHSIPESQMLILRTEHGTVLHTGDWKIEDKPIIGSRLEEEKLQKLGKEGVLAVVGDSTNCIDAKHSGTERLVEKTFEELFPKINKRIIVTCFASNIARIKLVIKAAKAVNRDVTLVGRSLWKNAEAAHASGYLPEFNNLLTEHEAMLTPRNKLVIISTGCQGEVRSALSRIAIEDHPEIDLNKGDTVIFSSRDIPGNEKNISRLQNNLIAKGLRVITADEEAVHVSGHCGRDEIELLYKLVKPKVSLPVHGEMRHQIEHAKLAEKHGVEETIIPKNGQIIRLGPGIREIVTTVQSGKLGLDGRILRPLDAEILKARKKMSMNGAAVVTLVMDRKGNIIEDPQVSIMGLEQLSGDKRELKNVYEIVISEILDSVEEMPKSSRLDDAAVKHKAGLAVRRQLNTIYGKKPLTDVHIVRI
ncbi:MAG: ribonuclease J [Alphaproteobacteria bacterium]|nr:ribonuclease J [Alphaproteobacteria bacterium]MCL2505427.1 ribonuclease J [Alphaproteobacteria bacterium]